MNEQSEILAFIDESGDPDFNENASKNFIIVAILIDNSYKEQLEIKLEELKSHYKFSELKSFKINDCSSAVIYFLVFLNNQVRPEAFIAL